MGFGFAALLPVELSNICVRHALTLSAPPHQLLHQEGRCPDSWFSVAVAACKPIDYPIYLKLTQLTRAASVDYSLVYLKIT